jgi:hypothetical protein
MAVYLLHSTVPLKRANGAEVRHYMGWTQDGCLPKRIAAHKRNRHSARLVQAFLAAGGELQVGRYWPELDRADESRLKRNGHVAQYCLICKLEELQRVVEEMNA